MRIIIPAEDVKLMSQFSKISSGFMFRDLSIWTLNKQNYIIARSGANLLLLKLDIDVDIDKNISIKNGIIPYGKEDLIVDIYDDSIEVVSGGYISGNILDYSQQIKLSKTDEQIRTVSLLCDRDDIIYCRINKDDYIYPIDYINFFFKKFKNVYIGDYGNFVSYDGDIMILNQKETIKDADFITKDDYIATAKRGQKLAPAIEKVLIEEEHEKISFVLKEDIIDLFYRYNIEAKIDGMGIIDVNGDLFASNKSLYMYLGKTPEKLLEKHCVFEIKSPKEVYIEFSGPSVFVYQEGKRIRASNIHSLILEPKKDILKQKEIEIKEAYLINPAYNYVYVLFEGYAEDVKKVDFFFRNNKNIKLTNGYLKSKNVFLELKSGYSKKDFVDINEVKDICPSLRKLLAEPTGITNYTVPIKSTSFNIIGNFNGEIVLVSDTGLIYKSGVKCDFEGFYKFPNARYTQYSKTFRQEGDKLFYGDYELEEIKDISNDLYFLKKKFQPLKSTVVYDNFVCEIAGEYVPFYVIGALRGRAGIFYYDGPDLILSDGEYFIYAQMINDKVKKVTPINKVPKKIFKNLDITCRMKYGVDFNYDILKVISRIEEVPLQEEGTVFSRRNKIR